MEGYHPNAPMEAISDNVYYDSQAQQNHQANEYTYHNQSNQTYLPPPPQFTSVNDTTRFPGLHLPYPNQLQDTRSMPQYDNRDLTPWSSRMSGGVQAETSPPIAQLIHHSFEPSHEEYPPMSRSHRYKMPRLPQELQQKQENEPQAKARPETHRNLVGTPGFPKPRPECEFKQKFTSEDDEVLKKLKHNFRDPFRAGSKDDSLTWWQIADFFPGRAPGTLQVHYCKEVSAKGPVWTEDLDNRLIRAIEEYEKERWLIIAKKVKGKNYAAACEERAKLLQEVAQIGGKMQYDKQDQGQQQVLEDEGTQNREQEMEEEVMQEKRRRTQEKRRKK